MDGQQHPLSPEAFVPLVLLCGKAQHMAVRALAAQALTAVAPLDDGTLPEQLLQSLPAANGPLHHHNQVGTFPCILALH